MRNAIKIILFVLLMQTMQAQQVGMYSHYFFKPMVYNPAFTGIDEGTNAMLINRTQWSGIKGAPQLNIFTLDGSLSADKAGLGITLISDRKGITKRMGGNISYSYRLKFNESTFLSFGLALGVIDHSVDYSKASIENISDPTLFFDAQRKTVLDGNAGFLFNWKALQLGFAVPQIMANKVNYIENTNVRAYYTNARHMMGSLRYKFNLSEEKGISIAPQALVRIVPGAPLQYDGNLNFEWKNKFWLGATYKSNYAIGINAGLQLYKQFSIGYSYDLITGSIGTYAGISHELMLNFRFGKKSKEEEIPSETNSRLDSLSTQIKELQDLNESKESENIAYQRKVDSLQMKLNESNQKINDLAKTVDQIKSNQSGVSNQNYNITTTGTTTTNNNQGQSNNITDVNQNKAAIDANTNKVMENNTWVITNSVTDLKDSKGATPKKGYYVIGGTFYYRDFAMAEVKRFKGLGFKNAAWMFSPSKEFNYVFLNKVSTKEEAFNKVNAAKSAGVGDAWILVLTE